MNKKKLLILISLVVVIAMGAFIIAKPVAIGYSTYQAIKSSNFTFEDYKQALANSGETISTLKKNLSEKESIISSLKNETKILQAQLSGVSEQISSIQDQSKKELQSKLEEISLLNLDLKNKNGDLKAMSTKFENLAQNTAKIICCKKKVDNPAISFYRIKDDKVVCLENSGTELHCNFG